MNQSLIYCKSILIGLIAVSVLISVSHNSFTQAEAEGEVNSLSKGVTKGNEMERIGALAHQYYRQQTASGGGGDINKITAIRERFLTGHEPGDCFGLAVASAGDVNGDGYDDVIVGALFNDAGGTDAGRAYIYFGGKIMDYMADVIITGESGGDLFGISVSSAGDVNGDGYADVIVGAHRYVNNTGKSYIFYGVSSFSGSIAASSADVTITGESEGDYFGKSVSSAGDVNSDGYADVIVGAEENDESGNRAGKCYIIYGGSNLSGNISGGSADVTITGEAEVDFFGNSVSSAGDVNGDGYADVIVGAYCNDDGGSNAGKSYIFYGAASLSGNKSASSADVTIIGEAELDYFGNSVSFAGDVNGDGYADVIVGAHGNDDGGSNAGKSYIFYGASSLSGNTTAGSADLTMTGEVAEDKFGFSVSSAGDINGDGYGDVIIGAYLNEVGGKDAGRAYVYVGGANMDNITDTKFTGEAPNDYFGYAVASAGDVNGDGYSDMIVGAYGNDTNGNDAGRAYLYLNSLTGTDIADEFLIGESAYNYFGSSVSSAGDVNGDGYADIIVGAYGYDNHTGKVYIFFGGQSMNNSADVTMIGEARGDEFGFSVSSAGDVNGDGYDDVIVGAHENDGGGNDAGKSYIFYGGPNLSGNIPAGSADVTMTGEAEYDNFGFSVSSAGDVNGDGYAEVIVGAYRSDYEGNDTGKIYIFYGSSNLSGNTTASNADVILFGEAEGDEFGFSVSSAGDVNGDGYDDVIVGARYNDYGGNHAGRSYIFYGGSSLPEDIPAFFWARVTMTGEAAGDEFGFPVSSAGDVNGDGYADVIIGAIKNDDGGNAAGKSYIFYGGSSISGNISAGNADVTMTGEAPFNAFSFSVSSAGDVNGDGYTDVIVGAPGNNDHGSSAGKSYIFYGGSNLSEDIAANVVMIGEAVGDRLGRSVSSAGDVNGDGYADVIVGAHENDNGGDDAGKAYLFISSAPPIVPRIVSVDDIPHDQGGSVTVHWVRSGYDALEISKIVDYVIQRSEPSGAFGFSWGDIATQQARHDPTYSYVVATPYDSCASSNGRFYYRIIATTSNPQEYWKSLPVAGYSVDNLSPNRARSLLAKVVHDTTVELTWDKNRIDPDVHHYTVYRSITDGFLPEPSLQIGTTTDTAFIDTAPILGEVNCYRVVTFDIHDNGSVPSPQASVVITRVVDNSKTMPTKYALYQNYPNPFNPFTNIRFDLPKRSQVILKLFDALGKEVAILVDDELSLGVHNIFFNAQSLPSGVYFYQLRSGSFVQQRRMVFIK